MPAQLPNQLRPSAAIARDPRYADAYVQKAIALRALAVNYGSTPAEVAHQLAEGDASARRAVMLAPRLGSAHAALAIIASGQLDFARSLRETKIAIALSPEDPDVLATLSRNLARLANAEEGLRLADRAIALDLLNPAPYYRKSEILLYLRRYPQAIEAGRKALELAPERNAHIWVGDALLLLNQPARAKTEYEAMSPDDPLRSARLAIGAARTGDRVEAERIIAELNQQYGATVSYQFGQIYVQLGDMTRAFAEFDNAMKAKDSGLFSLKVDPFLDPIREDPRYLALVRKLNFP